MNLSYHLIPGRCREASRELIQFHNEVFNYWKAFWTKNFKELDGTKPNPEEFDRQDVIGVLLDNTRIVGMGLTSFFQTRSLSAQEHRYFSNSYHNEFFDDLRAHEIERFMTIEYLTVDPDYRKVVTGFSMQHLLVGLAGEMMRARNCQAFIGSARQDLKVDRMVLEFGGKILAQRIFHGVPVASILTEARKLKKCPRPAEAAQIDLIWKQYQNRTLNQNKAKQEESAA